MIIILSKTELKSGKMNYFFYPFKTKKMAEIFALLTLIQQKFMPRRFQKRKTRKKKSIIINPYELYRKQEKL